MPKYHRIYGLSGTTVLNIEYVGCLLVMLFNDLDCPVSGPVMNSVCHGSTHWPFRGRTGLPRTQTRSCRACTSIAEAVFASDGQQRRQTCVRTAHVPPTAFADATHA